jgi:glycosyltransferase involved in cell wall biosynthesis
MRVALSTGIGRLHFVDAAQSLIEAGVDLRLITGYIPNESHYPVIRAVGGLMRQPNLHRRLGSRRLDGYKCNTVGLIGPEILNAVGGIMGPFVNGADDMLSALAFRFHGWCSRKALAGCSVFHVRSGAGGGGAIESAKSQGAVVVVDHSIAHPAFLMESLADAGACTRNNEGVKLSRLWKVVLDDCRKADILLVNSDFVKATFVERGFDEKRIRVAYLGLTKGAASVKTDYKRGDALRIVFSGHFNRRKGAHTIISAVKILRSNGYKIQLEVAGSLSTADSELGLDLEMGDKYLGFLDQPTMRKRLALSDVYVLPSFAEGCSRSGIEAMAVGLPVVVSASSGLPVRAGISGLLVDPSSPTELAGAIESLYDNERLRRELGEGARATIEDKISWGKYAKDVLAAYRDGAGQ